MQWNKGYGQNKTKQLIKCLRHIAFQRTLLRRRSVTRRPTRFPWVQEDGGREKTTINTASQDDDEACW